jgi:hypothetical protein
MVQQKKKKEWVAPVVQSTAGGNKKLITDKTMQNTTENQEAHYEPNTLRSQA